MLLRSKHFAIAMGTALAMTLAACGGGGTTGSSDATGVDGTPSLASAYPELATLAQVTAKTLTNCSALPASQRTTRNPNGAITAIDPACQAIATTANLPVGAPAFKHNGHDAVYTFYNFLTNAQLTGVQFSAPEIMAVFPGDSSTRDQAVLNIKYVDTVGNAGNQFAVAQKIPGTSTSTRPSNWWVTGNQWNYDMKVNSSVSRQQQYAPGSASGFRTGLEIAINSSTTAPNGALFDSVLVTGNGLPSTGLWYYRAPNSSTFSIATLRSSTPQPTASLTPACDCNTFWTSRTAGLTGVGASTLKANPLPESDYLNWAGLSDGSYNGAQGTRPTKGSVYTFNIYKNGTAVATETRFLLTDMVIATQAVNLPWNDIGPATASAMDVTNTALNGQQNTLTIDWIQNAAAEKMRDLWISQTDGGYDNATAINPQTSSVVATPNPVAAASTTFTSMRPADLSYNIAPFGGYREVGFAYGTLDGSSKRAVYSYYP